VTVMHTAAGLWFSDKATGALPTPRLFQMTLAAACKREIREPPTPCSRLLPLHLIRERTLHVLE